MLSSSSSRLVDAAKLFLLICAVLVSAVGQNLSYKRAGYAMGPFPYFILLMVTAACSAILWIVIGVWSMFKPGGFKGEQTSWPFRRKFIILGMWLSLNGVFIICSNPHVPGVLQSILLQTMTPCVVLLSIFYLKHRYRRLQLVGAVVVVAGIVLGLAGSLSKIGGTHVSTLWALAFMAGAIPGAAQVVYQEKVLSAAKFDLPYVVCWTWFFDLVFLCVWLPVNFIPSFGASPPNAMWHHWQDAFTCFSGTTPDWQPNVSPAFDTSTIDCSSAMGIVFQAVLFQLLSPLLNIVLVQTQGAVVSSFVTAISTPLTAIAFTLPALVPGHAESVKTLEIISLLILVAGLLLFRQDQLIAKFARKLVGLPPQKRLETPLLSGNDDNDNDDYSLYSGKSQDVDPVDALHVQAQEAPETPRPQRRRRLQSLQIFSGTMYSGASSGMSGDELAVLSQPRSVHTI